MKRQRRLSGYSIHLETLEGRDLLSGVLTVLTAADRQIPVPAVINGPPIALGGHLSQHAAKQGKNLAINGTAQGGIGGTFDNGIYFMDGFVHISKIKFRLHGEFFGTIPHQLAFYALGSKSDSNYLVLMQQFNGSYRVQGPPGGPLTLHFKVLQAKAPFKADRGALVDLTIVGTPDGVDSESFTGEFVTVG
jgi:hypothetical protein